MRRAHLHTRRLKTMPEWVHHLHQSIQLKLNRLLDQFQNFFLCVRDRNTHDDENLLWSFKPWRS